MAGVTAKIALYLNARLTAAPVGADIPQFNADVAHILEFTPGTNAVDKADLFYRAVRPLAGSANEDLDLAGVLANVFGSVLVAAEILVLLIEAADANAANIRVGPAAANGFTGPFNDATDRLNVKPGEYQLFVSQSGYPVVAGTGDKINVLNTGGAAVNYTITVIGRTVAA
jgi:hypothetical protein